MLLCNANVKLFLSDNSAQGERMSLIRELETLIHVGRHPNIVSLVGACTFEGEKNLIIITIFTIISKSKLIF